jgi:eukaryotic-like serine/threonine-protein kinase
MPTETPTLRGGLERIGQYHILEQIGRGAMGVVYRARDEALGRDVALKVMMTDLADDPEIRDRFQREAEAAAHLSHPNIITIFGFGEEDHRFYIAMELLRGTMLKDLLKQGPVSLDRAVDLMVQLCAGLGVAHGASIYHRDIKPGNIFVRADGLLKILDFGVARLSNSGMTSAGLVVGTPDYMSPEQARGDAVDGRSDIFSLGGVFYYLLSGRKPFPATELPALFRQIQEDEPSPLEPDVPAPLAAMVMKALSKEREQRYGTCEEIALDLDPIRQMYPLRSRGGIPASETTAIQGGSSTTDDTVDLKGRPFNSDDTVDITPLPSWTKRLTDRIDAAVSGTLARLKPGTPSTPAAASEAKKR